VRELNRDARSLIDTALAANRAPAAAHQHARKRFLSALTTGTLTTSALVAKGAALGTLGHAAGATATPSLATMLLGSVMIGISTGLLALAPATDVSDVHRDANRASASTARLALHPGKAAQAKGTVPGEPAVSSTWASNSAQLAETKLGPPASTVSGVRVERDHGASGSAREFTDRNEPELPAPSSDAFVPSIPMKASIAAETAMLADVQRALQLGRAASALAKLNHYDRAFPAGALKEEATAARVAALCAFGRKADAQRWAEEFFRRYPNSPLTARVRRACSGAEPPASAGRGSFP